MNEPPKFHTLPKTVNQAVLVALALLTLGASALPLQSPGWLRPLDYFFYDRLAKTFPLPPPASHRIAIVDIDDISLASAGQWPWPRYRIARLLAELSAARPRAMAMDILFPEPDRLSLKKVADQFKQDFNISLPLDGVPASLMDNDGFFGHILNQTRTVGARYFYFDHLTKNEVCKGFNYTIPTHDSLSRIPTAQGALCNTPPLETRLSGAGFINNQYDADGLLRKTPMLIRHHHTLFPHLALSLLMAEQGITRLETGEDRFGPVIQAGEITIPVTSQGLAHMRFSGGAGQFPYISAVDILSGNFDRALIRDNTILIGSSAVGLRDIHPTVLDPHFPGIEVSAVLLDNMYRQGFIRIPEQAPSAAGFAVLLVGITMALVFYYRPTPRALVLGTVAWCLILVLTAALLFTRFSIFLSPALPLLMAGFFFALLTFVRFAAEKQAAYNWFRKLSAAQQLTMQIMVDMVETRDPETGEHIVRTQHYARAVAEQLRRTGYFTDILTDPYIHTLFLSVPLHDIGKVGIPDHILLKPARLTDSEFRHMKLHATHGKAILHQAAKKIQGSNYLAMGEDIAATHHEKWDGTGYPRGLAGEEIPLSGRIMAIADVYDALISRRCYKPPFSHEKAMGIILEEKGKLFDPTIVEAFVAIEPEVKQIAEEFKDED